MCGQAPFNGQMDEVRYYGGALSPNQIQAAMGNGVVVTPSALVAAYSFDAGSGTDRRGFVGKGQHVDVHNTTWTSRDTNGALQFNGSSSRAELPAPATDLAFSSAFTITAWVRPTTLPSGWHVISARQRGTASDDSWFLGHNGTTLYFAAGANVRHRWPPGSGRMWQR